MEKKIWTMPQAEVEQFELNAYCASACGEENVVYKFECNAGKQGTLLGYDVYLNPNGVIGDGDDKFYMGYTPCSEKHEASTTDDFLLGYMRKDYGLIQGEAIPVIIWKGKNSDNVHCTVDLEMSSWETVKS